MPTSQRVFRPLRAGRSRRCRETFLLNKWNLCWRPVTGRRRWAGGILQSFFRLPDWVCEPVRSPLSLWKTWTGMPDQSQYAERLDAIPSYRCPLMSARRLLITYETADRELPADACFSVRGHQHAVSGATRRSVPWSNTRSHEPGLIHRGREPINSAMVSPARCFDKERLWTRLEKFCGIGAPRRQLSMPRLISFPWRRWHCLGREARNE